MSMPVMNGGPMVVVTHVQPVTMAAPVTPNHIFRKGYPLALGVRPPRWDRVLWDI